jgi:hypothetical protein
LLALKEQAAKEDPEKLHELVMEINCLLDIMEAQMAKLYERMRVGD